MLLNYGVTLGNQLNSCFRKICEVARQFLKEENYTPTPLFVLVGNVDTWKKARGLEVCGGEEM